MHGKVMEQIIKECFSKQLEENNLTQNSQQAYT